MKKASGPARKKAKKSDVTQRLMLTVLRESAALGWSDEALKEAARAEGLSQAEVVRAAPDGMADIVAVFVRWLDQQMMQVVAADKSFVTKRVRDKIGFCVRARLEMLGKHKDSMRRLIVWFAHPRHAVHSLKLMAATTDVIWRAAGDTATDYNYYTKRILLAAVMKATTLYWLQDDSARHAATWEFLDRRIHDVVRMGKSLSLASEWKLLEILGAVKSRIKG